jgi:hypothetical protein
MHTYTCIHTYTFIHNTYTHTYIHTHSYIYICIHSYIHTYIHIYIHIHAYVHEYINAYVHTYTHTHTHTYVHRTKHSSVLPARWVLVSVLHVFWTHKTTLYLRWCTRRPWTEQLCRVCVCVCVQGVSIVLITWTCLEEVIAIAKNYSVV